MNKSSNGFDARRQNKYSIRRFTVGTASIIVGATLLFGLGQEARAAETTANDSSQSTGSTSEQPNTPTDQPTPDAQTTQTETTQTTETQTNTAAQTETQPAETSKETAPTTAPETAEQPAPTQDAAQPEAQQTETTAAKEAAPETANQPAPEQESATQEAPAEQPVPAKEETAAKTEDTAVQAPKVQETAQTETAQKETSTANETAAPEQNNTTAPAENTVTETAPKQESAPEQNVTSTPQADTVENTALTAAPQQLTATEPTNAEVTGTNTDAATQQLAEQAGVTPQDSPEVAAAKLLQQSSQNKDANTIETVAETTPVLRSASAFTAGAPNDTLVTQTGANVNDLVTVSNAQITETAIDPNQGGHFALTGDYTVNGTVKQGDYFTFQFPDNVNLDGALDYTGNDNKMVFSLDSPAGFTIADGSYDTNTKTLTYTFTDWVNGKDNIAGSFNIAQFPDRQDAQSVGTYPLNYDLAGEAYSPEITYNYSPVDEGFESASLSSSISDVDNTNTTNTFKQTIYVNPQDKTLNDAFVTLAPKEGSSAIINTTDSKFQIYKVDDPNTLTDSYYFDTTGKQDLAADFQNAGQIHTNQDGLVQIDFGAIDSPYVIIMETPFDTTIGNEITTRDTIYTTDTNNIKNSYYWDNGVIVSDSSGTGDGTEQTYRLGDYVWEDTNKDGIQDAGESALQGVNVTLKDEGGNVLQNAVTDQYGNYLFTDLANGNYVVEFATPEGYEPTVQGDGTNADVDSNGLVAKATIQDGDNLTIDSGFYKPTPVPATYNLGDYVWEDSNKDGIQNSNEVGIGNVTVTLTKPDGTTETATTDAQGKYNFTGLENGEYTVEFTAPEGYEATLTNVGDQALDSNGLKTTATINNADNKTIDSGFYKPTVEPTPVPATYTIGDKVWDDSNKDGVQNSNEKGIEGVKVTLTDKDGTTTETTTDVNGNYKFTGLYNGEYTVTFETPEGYEGTKVNVGDKALDSDGSTVKVVVDNADDFTIDSGFYKPTVEPTPVPATYTIGDKVWDDSNKDGVQNSNEKGIEGVKVTLTDKAGTTTETTTDVNGNYKFTGLYNGEYTVTFETPEGYEGTKVNVGDKALDSDGSTVKVVVDNADDFTIDSGFYKPTVEPTPVPATYTIGDKVWNDSNKDGVQNSNEKGIEGVKVTLTDKDGTTTETTTDANGNYKFTGLYNGEYTVTFETPEGYEGTKVNVGDKALDSDGSTVKVVVDNADDFTIDSGFYKPVVEPEKPEVPEEPNTPEQPEKPEVPEEPNTPEQPEKPEVPEEPNTPEQPEKPEVPEEPNTPEQPEKPEVPEEPNTPEQPEKLEVPEEPNTPEQPEQPEVPVQPNTPEEPSEPVKPSVDTPAVSKEAEQLTAPAKEQPAKTQETEELPDTGNSTGNATLFGGLFAALGSVFLFNRRKKDSKENK